MWGFGQTDVTSRGRSDQGCESARARTPARWPLPCPEPEAIRGVALETDCIARRKRVPRCSWCDQLGRGQLRPLRSGAGSGGAREDGIATFPTRTAEPGSCFPLPRLCPGSGVTGCLPSFTLEWTLGGSHCPHFCPALAKGHRRCTGSPLKSRSGSSNPTSFFHFHDISRVARPTDTGMQLTSYLLPLVICRAWPVAKGHSEVKAGMSSRGAGLPRGLCCATLAIEAHVSGVVTVKGSEAGDYPRGRFRRVRAVKEAAEVADG